MSKWIRSKTEAGIRTALRRSSSGSSSAPNEFMSFWKWALSGNAQQNLHNLPFINQSIHSTVRADSLRVSPEGLGLNTTNSVKSHSSLPFYIHVMMCDLVIQAFQLTKSAIEICMLTLGSLEHGKSVNRYESPHCLAGCPALIGCYYVAIPSGRPMPWIL